MFKHLIALSLGLTFVGLASGCSSDDGGGGGSSTGVDPLVQAACDKQTADCGEDHECTTDVGENNALAEIVGCATEYDAVLKCMAEAQWQCTGTETWGGVAACDDQQWDYRGCQPGYGFTGTGTECDASIDFADGKVGAACSGSGSSCSCTMGPKQGTQFSVSECDTAPLLEGIADHCR